MSPQRFPFAIGLSCLLLSGCGVSKPKAPGAESRVKVEQWLKPERNGLEEVKNSDSVQIPLVEFGGLSRSFGQPKWSTGPHGQYQSSHGNEVKLPEGECYGLYVFGTPAPAPVLNEAPSVLEPGRPGELDESPRTWSTVQVPGLNRSLRYHFATSAFGDTDNTWESEPFTVTTPDGKTGSYQATVECETADVAKTMFSKLRVR
jgi:hypothetical protein